VHATPTRPARLTHLSRMPPKSTDDRRAFSVRSGGVSCALAWRPGGVAYNPRLAAFVEGSSIDQSKCVTAFEAAKKRAGEAPSIGDHRETPLRPPGPMQQAEGQQRCSKDTSMPVFYLQPAAQIAPPQQVRSREASLTGRRVIRGTERFPVPKAQFRLRGPF
jgi:hypothetical protein